MTVYALEAARRLAPRLAARAAGHDRDGSFPVDDFADLRQAGLFGLMVPRELGGQGATFAEYAAVATELARGNGATALVFNMHASVTGALGAVTEELAEALGVPEEALAARDRLLRAAADGAWYAVAMSERGAGARLSQLSTVYEPVDGGWHVKGSKTFCSGAGHPDGYLVAARSATDQSVVSQFLVPAGEGITVEPTWDSLGMRATSSHDLHLDVTVPADRLLGGVEGLALVVAQLMPHWLVASYAAVYVGVARAAIDAAAEHLNTRGLAGLPAVRARLGRADAATAAAELVVAEAARRVDEEPGLGRDEPLGVAGQAAGRHHRRGGGGVHAGGGRHVGDPPWSSDGAPLPGRPVRLAAPGHLRRVRRLAGHRRTRRRPGPGQRGPSLVSRSSTAAGLSEAEVGTWAYR